MGLTSNDFGPYTYGQRISTLKEFNKERYCRAIRKTLIDKFRFTSQEKHSTGLVLVAEIGNIGVAAGATVNCAHFGTGGGC